MFCVCIIVYMIYKAYIIRFIGQAYMHSIGGFE